MQLLSTWTIVSITRSAAPSRFTSWTIKEVPFLVFLRIAVFTIIITMFSHHYRWRRWILWSCHQQARSVLTQRRKEPTRRRFLLDLFTVPFSLWNLFSLVNYCSSLAYDYYYKFVEKYTTFWVVLDQELSVYSSYTDTVHEIKFWILILLFMNFSQYFTNCDGFDVI